VLGRMRTNGWIEKADEETAKAEPLTIVERLDTDENQAAAYYVEELRKDILALGEKGELGGIKDKKEAQQAFYEGGLSIRSTLDSNMQLIAQTALRAGLETYDRRHGWRGPVGTIEKPGDDFEEQLTAFANLKDNKPKIAGSGNNWLLAVVRSTGKEVRLGLVDGTTGTMSGDDVKWAGPFKRGKAGGVQVGDVVFVSRDATPDVTTQVITQYATPAKGGGSSPWRLRQMPQVQGALVAMDPHTGRVYAMAGGYSFQSSQFNRAIQAKRQPGSSFKPFVYVAALEQGRTPSTRVLDAPYVSCEERATADKIECYRPENYSMKFYGLSTLRFGVEQSRNVMTVRLASDIGLDKVSELGERMGIYDKLPAYESMSLGAGETTPLRMATAYAEMVNGGKEVRPVMMDRIQNRYGETVYRTDKRECPGCQAEWKDGTPPPALADTRKQLLDPVTAYQMVSILEGVVERGTATTVKSVGKPVAAKTGTTNDYTDAWTVGFSPDLVAAVWIGFDTGRMGENESGGRLAAPVFRDFMLAALKDRPALPFRIPSDVQLVEVDVDTGCLPTPSTRRVITEAFKIDTAPTETCELPVGTDGYRVDYSQVTAGDEREVVPTTTPVPGVPLVPGPEIPLNPQGQPVDPNQPQPPAQPTQPTQPTIKDPIF
jgi:penicillin-binding protein 1A